MISAEEIAKAVAELGKTLTADYAVKEPSPWAL